MAVLAHQFSRVVGHDPRSANRCSYRRQPHTRTASSARLKLRLLAVGRAPRWIDEGFAHYAGRLPAQNSLELVVVTTRRRETDTRALLAAVRPREAIVMLDQRGATVSSEQFATLLEEWRMAGRDVALLVGGVDGFDATARQQAQSVLSLSALTFPHQLVRVLVAEQVYRAWAIRSGHPYHRQPAVR